MIVLHANASNKPISIFCLVMHTYAYGKCRVYHSADLMFTQIAIAAEYKNINIKN